MDNIIEGIKKGEDKKPHAIKHNGQWYNFFDNFLYQECLALNSSKLPCEIECEKVNVNGKEYVNLKAVKILDNNTLLPQTPKTSFKQTTGYNNDRDLWIIRQNAMTQANQRLQTELTAGVFNKDSLSHENLKKLFFEMAEECERWALRKRE